MAVHWSSEQGQCVPVCCNVVFQQWKSVCVCVLWVIWLALVDRGLSQGPFQWHKFLFCPSIMS